VRLTFYASARIHLVKTSKTVASRGDGVALVTCLEEVVFDPLAEGRVFFVHGGDSEVRTACVCADGHHWAMGMHASGLGVRWVVLVQFAPRYTCMYAQVPARISSTLMPEIQCTATCITMNFMHATVG
jgi:hypothetical protein